MTIGVPAKVFGNLLMTVGVNRRGGALGSSVLQVMFKPYTATGICLLIVWMLARMALLSWADLSYVLPVTSVGYVLTAVVGRIFLGEPVTPQRWAGAAIVMAGTALVGSTAVRTHDSAAREDLVETAR